MTRSQEESKQSLAWCLRFNSQQTSALITHTYSLTQTTSGSTDPPWSNTFLKTNTRTCCHMLSDKKTIETVSLGEPAEVKHTCRLKTETGWCCPLTLRETLDLVNDSAWGFQVCKIRGHAVGKHSLTSEEQYRVCVCVVKGVCVDRQSAPPVSWPEESQVMLERVRGSRSEAELFCKYFTCWRNTRGQTAHHQLRRLAPWWQV